MTDPRADGWSAQHESRTLLVELAESLRSELAVLGDDEASVTKGMRLAYLLIIQSVDDYVRREQVAAQAKSEYHAKYQRIRSEY